MFATAVNKLSDYRLQRGRALNNEVRQGWSTSSVDSLKAFVDVFSSATENAEWQTMYNKQDQVESTKVQALGLQVAFLAGCRRDVRIMYVAGDDDRGRSALDWERYEYMRLIFHRLKIQSLSAMITAKAKGVKAITA